MLSIDVPDLVHQLTELLRAHAIFIPTDASLCMCGIDAEEMVVNKKAGCASVTTSCLINISTVNIKKTAYIVHIR